MIAAEEVVITTGNRVLALVCGLGVLLLIVELVRRRRLKEEYSVLWVMTGIVVLVLAGWLELLGFITDVIGGTTPSSTLFFFGLVFVFMMLLHFSIRFSAMERKHTGLVQEIGLMGIRRQDASSPPLVLDGAEGWEDAVRSRVAELRDQGSEVVIVIMEKDLARSDDGS
ncbi:MAG: DUF2304 domain-containing protein [Solirubrobacteraceae bacterium]